MPQTDEYRARAGASGYLKNAGGEYGNFNCGEYFNANQCEWHFFTGPKDKRWDADEGRIFLVELEDGTWLASQYAGADAKRYPNRAEAMKAAAQRVIWNTSKRASFIGYDQANAIMKWAAELGGVEALRFEPRKKVKAIEMMPAVTEDKATAQIGLWE